MKKTFTSMRSLLQETAELLKAQQKSISNLLKDRKNYAEDFAKVNIDPKISRLQAEVRVARQMAYEKMAQLIQDFEIAAAEKHHHFDLSNPAWANALKLIELSGANLDGDTVRKINENFRDSQPALRALQSVYKSQGVAYDGGLDKQIYDIDAAVRTFSEWNAQILRDDSSFNGFSSVISKIAKMEGEDFPKMIDQAGADDRMRGAAGLSSAE